MRPLKEVENDDHAATVRRPRRGPHIAFFNRPAGVSWQGRGAAGAAPHTSISLLRMQMVESSAAADGRRQSLGRMVDASVGA